MNDLRHDPHEWTTPGGARVREHANHVEAHTALRLTPAPGNHPPRNLRTLDEREADDVAALTARIEALEAQLVRLARLLDVRL